MKRSNLLVITQTGLAIALIVLAQLAGKLFPAGAIIFGPLSFNQLLTGSLVNMVFVVLVLRSGLVPAIAAGIISSIMALILHIGPIFPQLVPIIALSNVLLVCIIALVKMLFDKRLGENTQTNASTSRWHALSYLFVTILIAAFAKFMFLKFFMPIAFDLIKELAVPQRNILSMMFSWPQLITALIGGLFGIVIFSILKVDSKNTNQIGK